MRCRAGNIHKIASPGHEWLAINREPYLAIEDEEVLLRLSMDMQVSGRCPGVTRTPSRYSCRCCRCR